MKRKVWLQSLNKIVIISFISREFLFSFYLLNLNFVVDTFIINFYRTLNFVFLWISMMENILKTYLSQIFFADMFMLVMLEDYVSRLKDFAFLILWKQHPCHSQAAQASSWPVTLTSQAPRLRKVSFHKGWLIKLFN